MFRNDLHYSQIMISSHTGIYTKTMWLLLVYFISANKFPPTLTYIKSKVEFNPVCGTKI